MAEGEDEDENEEENEAAIVYGVLRCTALVKPQGVRFQTGFWYDFKARPTEMPCVR